MEPVQIEFFRPAGRRYRSVLHRRDGLLIELDGGGYNQVGGPARELPHDLAHFVVEDALGLDAGLWGVIAAGGMFVHTKVIAGRRPPHAAKRAQAVVDRAGPRLAQAEGLTRAVCDVAKNGDRALLVALKTPIAPDTLATACRALHAMSTRWRQLAAGEVLTVWWRLPPPR